MIDKKAKGLTIEQYADNVGMLESYLGLLQDEDVDDAAYIMMMYLMRNNVFMVKSVLVLADYLSKNGLLNVTENGDIVIKGEEIDANEKFALTETFCLIKDITPFMEKIGAEELEMLSILFQNEMLKSVDDTNSNDNEVQ